MMMLMMGMRMMIVKEGRDDNIHIHNNNQSIIHSATATNERHGNFQGLHKNEEDDDLWFCPFSKF